MDKLLVVKVILGLGLLTSFGVCDEPNATEPAATNVEMLLNPETRFDTTFLVLELRKNERLRNYLKIDSELGSKIAEFTKSSAYSRIDMDYKLSVVKTQWSLGARFITNEMHCRDLLAEIIGPEKLKKARIWQLRYRNYVDLAACFSGDYAASMMGLEGQVRKEYHRNVSSLGSRYQKELDAFKIESSIRTANSFPARVKSRVAIYFDKDVLTGPFPNDVIDPDKCPLPSGIKSLSSVDYLVQSYEKGNPLGLDSNQLNELALIRANLHNAYRDMATDPEKLKKLYTDVQKLESQIAEDAWETIDPIQRRKFGGFIAWKRFCWNPRLLFDDQQFVDYVGYKANDSEWKKFFETVDAEKQLVITEATRLQKLLYNDLAKTMDSEQLERFALSFEYGW